MICVKTYTEDSPLIKNKILQFLQKHSKGVIAFLVALSILLSLVGAVPIVLLIRDLTAEKKPAATTSPTTSSVDYTIPSTDEQIKAAIATLTERLEKAKDDSALYTQRAALYYHLEEYEKAIADYTSALEIYPHPHNYYLRAVVYSVSGDDQHAYQDLAKALKDKPTETDYLSLMADTCIAKKAQGSPGMSGIIAGNRQEKCAFQHFGRRCLCKSGGLLCRCYPLCKCHYQLY
jgi:tetratricopeptide (TPR) repeat protein